MSEEDKTVNGEGSGSLEIAVGDALELHDHIAMKEKGPKGGKPILKVKAGDSFYHKTGEWNTLEQVVDRTNPSDKRYRKTIRNSKGELIRDEDIPLPEKQGHGHLFTSTIHDPCPNKQ